MQVDITHRPEYALPSQAPDRAPCFPISNALDTLLVVGILRHLPYYSFLFDRFTVGNGHTNVSTATKPSQPPVFSVPTSDNTRGKNRSRYKLYFYLRLEYLPSPPTAFEASHCTMQDITVYGSTCVLYCLYSSEFRTFSCYLGSGRREREVDKDEPGCDTLPFFFYIAIRLFNAPIPGTSP